MKKHFILLFFSLIFIFNGCKKINSENNKKTENNSEIIIRMSGGNLGIPNPFRHNVRGPGFSKMQLIYDSLLEKDENGLIPWIAKKWEISSDGKKYKFYLQENILWHDNIKLTAKDIKFTFEYYKKHYPVSNYLLNNNEYIIKNINVLDPYTVEIETTISSPAFLEKIGFSRIIPKHIWEKVDDPIKYNNPDSIIGSGPFFVKDYNTEEGTYKFNAFSKYWGLKPKVQSIEWVPVSDPVLAFENNQIDLINISNDLIKRYEKNKEFKIVKKFSFHNYRLMMNMEKNSLFNNKDFRKALAYGINRQNLINKVERGSGILGSMGYIPETHKYFNKDLEKYEYNPDKSLTLLKGKKVSLNLLVSNSPKEIKIAELIKIDLNKIGIKLSVKSVDSKMRDAAVMNKTYDFVLINSGGLGGDPTYLNSIYSKDGDIPGYENKEISSLLYKQSIELNEEKRKEYLYSLQKLISEDIPMILLYGNVDNYVYRPAKYDGWMFRYDHTKTSHCKLSYLERE